MTAREDSTLRSLSIQHGENEDTKSERGIHLIDVQIAT
jgi:hypothetical protein